MMYEYSNIPSSVVGAGGTSIETEFQNGASRYTRASSVSKLEMRKRGRTTRRMFGRLKNSNRRVISKSKENPARSAKMIWRKRSKTFTFWEFARKLK